MNIKCIKSDGSFGVGLGAAAGSLHSSMLFNGYTIYKHMPAWYDDVNNMARYNVCKSRYSALARNVNESDVVLLFTTNKRFSYSRYAVRLSIRYIKPIKIVNPYACLSDKAYMQIALWLKKVRVDGIRLCVVGDLEIQSPCIQSLSRRAIHGIVTFSN